MEEPVEGKET